jgi:hypothetical protein
MLFSKKNHYFCLVLFFIQLACGIGSGNTDTTEEPTPTKIPNEKYLPNSETLNCPKGTHLTFENFGKGYLLNHCLSCHSSHLSKEQRNKAPIEKNFNQQEHVVQFRPSILKVVQKNSPDHSHYVNRSAQTDKEQFIKWLNCGSP